MSTDAPTRRPTNPSRRVTARLEEALPISRVQLFLWATAYVVVTTLSFAPALTFRAAPAKAGAIAEKDVVAPRDLIVPDPAATARRRTEASAEVLPVYDWDPNAVQKLEREISESFQRAREAWSAARRRRLSPAFRDAFDLPVGDEALTAMARLDFSHALEERLTSAAGDLYRAGVVDNKDLLMENRDRGISVRDGATGRETRRRDLSEVVEYGAQAKVALNVRLAGGPLKGREISEVSAFLAAALRPNLTYNGAETARRREEASRSVEIVLTKIPRGKVIVRKGDEISARAADWIAAARASVSDVHSWLKVAGIGILQVLAATAFWVDARRQRRRKRERRPEVVYGSILASGIVFSLLTRGAFALTQVLSSSFEGGWAAHTSYAIPFAAGSIMASLVAGMGPALLFAAVHAIGSGVLMGQSFSFTLFALLGSLAGIFSLRRVGARSALLLMGGAVGLANVISILVISFLSGEARTWDVAFDAVGGIAGGFFVAMVVESLLPLFERVFHVTTEIKLLELSNQNLPLLRNLAMEAPGTYQHSLMLGHLAETAAEAIGADPLLARVAGYYHDIGKTRMPDYFIENQSKGFNRHDRLEPSMSALIIAAHVKEGVEMAQKARLPEPIVTAIREHHGTKLIRYFYQKAVSKAEPGEEVAEIEYRYPGPKPSTRILGILMIADAVEAASRTLVDPTPAKIGAMIRQIVDDCLRDGQFDECDLTMRDLSIIVEALEKTVATVFHHRIDYPGFDFNRGARRRASGDTGAAGPRAV